MRKCGLKSISKYLFQFSSIRWQTFLYSIISSKNRNFIYWTVVYITADNYIYFNHPLDYVNISIIFKKYIWYRKDSLMKTQIQMHSHYHNVVSLKWLLFWTLQLIISVQVESLLTYQKYSSFKNYQIHLICFFSCTNAFQTLSK